LIVFVSYYYYYYYIRFLGQFFSPFPVLLGARQNSLPVASFVCMFTNDLCFKIFLSTFYYSVNKNKLRGFKSASKLYRPIGCLLSAKLVPNVAGRGVSLGQCNGSLRPLIPRLEPLLFHSTSSSVIFTSLGGPRSRPIASQKIWQRRESNTGPLDL
jgi:hypothetical protein